jgi:O-antigen/teichoic acid export membrane protein
VTAAADGLDGVAVALDGGLVDGDGPTERPSVGRGLSFAAGSFMVSAVVALASSVATSRLYGVGVIGEYALVSAPYAVASQISQVNEGTAFVRAAAALPARSVRVSALFRAVFAFSMVLTATMAVVVFAGAALLLRGPVGRPDLVWPAAVIMLAYVAVDNVNWNIDSVLSAFRAGSPLFWARTAQVVAFLVVSVAMTAVTTDVWGLVVATVAMFAVPLVIRLAVIGRYVRSDLPAGSFRVAVRELPAMLRFGLVLTPSVFLGALTNHAGTWVVGAGGTVAATGAYARAMGLASRFIDAGYRVAEILMPGLVERRALGDHDGAAALLHRTLRVVAVPLLAVSAGVGGAASGLLRVFGPGFSRANVVLACLCFAYVLAVLAYVQSQGFLAVGRPGLVTWQTSLTSIPTLLTIYPMFRLFGVAGVAAAYVAWRALLLVPWDRRLGKELTGGRWLLGPRLLAALAVVSVAGYGVAWVLEQVSNGMVMTVVAAAAGAATSVALSCVTGLLTADERSRLLGAVRERRRGAAAR